MPGLMDALRAFGVPFSLSMIIDVESRPKIHKTGKTAGGLQEASGPREKGS